MYLILLSIFVPMAAGLCLLILPEKNIVRARLLSAVSMAYLLTAVLVTAALTRCYDVSYTLFHLTASLPVCFHIDETGVLFAALTLIVLLCAGFFSFAYMKHEQKEKRYYGFYLIVFGVLNALCFAGNLITFYLFFEMLTLTSMPLVLHNGSREAIMAGLKYLFYSLCGAYMALFGIYFIWKNSSTLAFTAGGVLHMTTGGNISGPDSLPGAAAGGNTAILLIAACVCLLGFGVKAGMFPMHAWLPAAHPVFEIGRASCRERV